jgi:hypothetical protein
VFGGVSATAAVNAGDRCTKAGITSVAAGKKFTCIKSGKKLIWNKGVALRAAAKPQVTPTATDIPTTSTNPTVKPSFTPIPSSKEIEKLDLLVANALKSARPVSATVDFQVGPGSEVAILASIAKDSLDSALLIAGILGIEFSKPIKAYIGTREWLTPKMPAGTWCVDPVIGVPGSGSGGFCGLDSGVIFISLDGYLDDTGNGKNRDFTKNPDKILVSFGFVHEMVHWMQGEATVKYAKIKGLYNPYWLNEGGANFGAMISQAYLYKVPFSKIRTYITNYSGCVFSSDAIKIVDYISNTGQKNVCGPYYSGYLWSEYLVATTGDIKSLLDLAKQQSKVDNEVTWDPNKPEEFNEKRLAVSLKNQYGIDFQSFVQEAESYAKAASKKLALWLQANSEYWPANP